MNILSQFLIAIACATLCFTCSQGAAEEPQQRPEANLVAQTTEQKSEKEENAKKDKNAEKEKKESCCTEQEAGEAMSDESLYQLGSVWTSQNSEEVKLEDLRGKPRVVAMIFTHCVFACPRITSDMQAVEALLPKNLQGKVGFVLFSIDPERDTPKALKSFAKKMNLDITRWTLLRGEKSDVQELAALLGVKYKQEANGDFSHSNIITVLNEEGEIVYRQEGLNQEPQGAVDALSKILQAQ